MAMPRFVKSYASRKLLAENKSLRNELAETKAELEKITRQLDVVVCENRTLAAVVARNQKRIEAETAQAAAQIAASENLNEPHTYRHAS